MDDIEAIRRLTHEYGFYYDTRQRDRWAALFVEDAVLDLTSIGLPRSVRRDEIASSAEVASQGTAHWFHLCSNQIIDVDGATATGTCYVRGYTRSHDGTDNVNAGYYEDQYVRTDAGWRFAARTFRPLIPRREPD
jgi:hypothetical protein